MIIPKTTKEFLSHFEVERIGELKVVKMSTLDFALLENLSRPFQTISLPTVEGVLIVTSESIPSKIDAINKN